MAIASVAFDPAAISAADSKADSAAVVASTANSTATSAGTTASTANSNAVVASTAASSVAVVAGSAIGSEPTTGEFIVTDIKRNAAGSIVIDYNDSAINP